MASYRQGMSKSSYDVPQSVFEKAEKREQKKWDAILKMDGEENPFELHEELSVSMLRDVTIERKNPDLDKVLGTIDELEGRWKNVNVLDTSSRANHNAQFVRHFANMLVLARVIAQGARNRDESRGAHFKPEFPERNDAEFLRTTLAFHQAGEKGGPSRVKYVREFDYPQLGANVHITDAVDISLVKPRPRKYEQAGAASAAAKKSEDKTEAKKPTSAEAE